MTLEISLIVLILTAAITVLTAVTFKIKSTITSQQQLSLEKQLSFQADLIERISSAQEKLSQSHSSQTSSIQKTLREQLEHQFTQIHQRELDHIQHLQNTLRNSLSHQAQTVAEQIEKLSGKTEEKLREISGQVDNRLNEGFEKTQQTFTDIVKRLALIDDAQKKLSELSSNVVGLQEILVDKRSRGAFGEVQLKNLIENVLPKEIAKFQYQLKNGTRADCVLLLPPPNGTIAIDSKFPLENYQRASNFETSDADKKLHAQQFKQDIKKHINDIADKYIIPGVTANSAIMFIPAEAIFAEIHATYPELVQYANEKRVWLTSPTTMMAIITTANTVLKDSLTQKHIQTIQNHLQMLAKDFSRFEARMDKLSTHINQVHTDVTQVHTSAKKISDRFHKIEQARLPEVTNQSSEIEQLDRDL